MVDPTLRQFCVNEMTDDLQCVVSEIRAVHAGEELLLYHKRLALAEESCSFMHENDLLEHWDRYAATSRILQEVRQFAHAVHELLDGYERLARKDQR